jgi:threonine dehydrogenase-like Zn-dependent dehydrogenase
VRAVVVTPGQAGSGRLEDVAEPQRGPGDALVEVIEVGVCGTDAEILDGKYGAAPEGESYLIIGHENFGRVLEAPPEAPVAPGDLVACEVRRPDPVPCPSCAARRQDLCMNGRFKERGIKGLHGFMAERYVEQPSYLVRVPAEVEHVGVLMEPLSVVEKAVAEAEAIQRRLPWDARQAVVTGAGPIGLMATLLLRAHDWAVWTLDIVERDSLKAQIVEATGATYVKSDEEPLRELVRHIPAIDLVLEATGVPEVVFDSIETVGPNGVVCLTGVSTGSRLLQIPAGRLNLEMVLDNKVVFGSVNASRRDWMAAGTDLARFERLWPGTCERMLTRRVPPERYAEALEGRDGDVKATIRFA